MARTKTNTVEYFPHVAKSGKTLFILEGKYGNDGYAFWFKLLEILAFTEDHFYNAAAETDWQYFVARSRVSEISATEMLSLLANLGNIDADLWKNHKIIWCQALIDNLAEVYRKRKRDLPTKPEPLNCDRNEHICDRNTTSANISTPESTQSKVEESKGKNPLTPFQKIIAAWNTLKPELLPKAELTDKRKPKIKAAWKEHPDIGWFESLFADISLSSWHSHRDRWQGCSFDWILKNRTEMREKLDAIKKSNGGSRHPPANAPPDEPKDILVPVPRCPYCGGKGTVLAPPGSPNKYEPCKCLHPVNEVKNEPSQASQATASAQ